MTAMTPLVFADCETTSLDPRRRLAWDVALIRRDEHGQTETQFYVEVDLRDADPFALAIGRFYERHPLGHVLSGRARRVLDAMQPLTPGGFLQHFQPGCYLTAAAAAMQVATITHGAHVVGAIPSFDTDTFDPALREVGLVPSWHHHIVDVEALAVGYLNGRAAERGVKVHTDATPPWKSDDLGRWLGVEPATAEERHTALGDARWGMRMYDAIMGTTPAAADLELASAVSQ